MHFVGVIHRPIQRTQCSHSYSTEYAKISIKEITIHQNASSTSTYEQILSFPFQPLL